MTENKGLGKTSLGIDANLAALLAYAVFWMSGLVIFLLEKDNKFVRFHAIQSIAAFGVLFTINYVFKFISPFVTFLLSLVIVILWAGLMMKAYKGEMYKLPFVGEIAEKYC